MTTDYVWHEAYEAAILETDWTKMRERQQAAESEISKRQHVLSMDHGGTPEERQAIADALKGMKNLGIDVGQWLTEQENRCAHPLPQIFFNKFMAGPPDSGPSVARELSEDATGVLTSQAQSFLTWRALVAGG